MNLLSSLRYLVALHEHRHFGRAAQACYITQPALSNALRALETEFGVVIVKRDRAFAGFTPEGERVLAKADALGGCVGEMPLAAHRVLRARQARLESAHEVAAHARCHARAVPPQRVRVGARQRGRAV